jgi:hypothetical protein
MEENKDLGAFASEPGSREPSPTVSASGFDPSRSFSCAAREAGTAGGNDPQDCDWPVCGCDPYANKVIEALDESGRLADGCTAHVPNEAQMDREAAAWRAGECAASEARRRAAYPEGDF